MMLLMKYLELNLLIGVAAVISALGLHLFRSRGLISAQSLLRAQYGLLSAMLILPLASLAFPTPHYQPAAQIWAAPSMKTLPSELPIQAEVTVKQAAPSHLPAESRSDTSIAWLLLLLLPALLHLRDRRALDGLLTDTWTIRRLGRLHIVATERAVSPLSCRRGGDLLVVLPLSVIADPQMYRVALAHELQHHRQGDTRMSLFMNLLTKSCFWNPLVHLWMRDLQHTQEYACDEALIGRNAVSPQVYGHCLLQVASNALDATRRPVGTTGMAAGASATLLKRRIDMMFQTKKRGGAVAAIYLLGAAFLLTASSFAARGLVKDRRISMKDAQTWAEEASRDSAMPIVANAHVLKQLNRYLGTPDGRAFLRDSLENLNRMEDLMGENLDKYHMPVELTAVAILESGVRELGVNEKPPHAAGMWQFIPGTARNFNLRVDDEVDQRLDPKLATDAAMRLLGSLHLRFQDWGLALMAYNAGAGRIQRGINDTGERDAWSLIEAGYEGDAEYLSRLVAIMIIMDQPHLLD